MKNILYILIFVSSCAAYAQEDSSSKEEEKDSTEYNTFKEHVPYWRMEKNWKLTPFDMFSVIPTFGVDHEIVMSPFISFQYGAAFIPSFAQFMSVGDETDQFNWMNGYQLRFESRYRVFKSPWVYVATEIACRHLVINDRTAFGANPDQFGNFTYFEERDMLYHRFTTQLNLKIGWQFILGEKMVMDIFTGVSLRRNNVISGSEGIEGGVAQTQDNVFGQIIGPFSQMWELRDGFKMGYAVPIINFRIGWHKPAKAEL